MSIPAMNEVVVTAEQDTSGTFVDWAAIIAGIVLASAISIVLLSFGSAIGLGFVNFRAGADVLPFWVALAAALWLLWVQVSSFMAGAYLTGRLRKRHEGATEHEVDVRDGAHGLLVWGGALVVGAIIATGGIGAAASAVGSATAAVTTAVSNAEPDAYFVDTLFRTPATATAAPVADSTAVRAEAGRIIATGAVSGTVSDADKAYLGQLVASNTGLSADEATARVNDVMTAIDTARAEAARVAEAARRTGVIAAFLVAASLLVSAAGAFWAAQQGGNHRDKGTAFVSVFRRL
ncbi:hypothetical protein [Devosia sp.]|uniref:hypothetical protein n=1 Tax=Devosia sp. TaxID=1871048 RepID=UPI003BAC4FB2